MKNKKLFDDTSKPGVTRRRKAKGSLLSKDSQSRCSSELELGIPTEMTYVLGLPNQIPQGKEQRPIFILFKDRHFL